MDRGTLEDARARWNGARFVLGSERGHYESWFQRANHPTRPLAFWIRYTVFSPRGHGENAVGELWAVFFDGEQKKVVAVKEEHPIARCRFSPTALDVTIAEATLGRDGLEGACRTRAHAIAWSLRFTSPNEPFLVLPERLYDGGFPKAKALVGSPNARFDGTLDVDGTKVAIDGWVGSQCHNWGSEHTAEYAWGQVAGFDEDPDSFLELSTARVTLGPIRTPPATVLVLRDQGEEIRLNAVHRAFAARAFYAPFYWEFATRGNGVKIRGTIGAPGWAFVALPYPNPPGGIKTCLNSKLARCTLEIDRGGRVRTLTTANRAAFELLGDASAPSGVELLDR